MEQQPSKFQEAPPEAPSVPAQGTYLRDLSEGPPPATVNYPPQSTNPFVRPVMPAPTPVQVENNITSHDKLWKDTQALILDSRRLGVNLEVLIRGANQEIERIYGKQ